MKLIFPISLILISGLIFTIFTNPLYKDVKNLKNDVSAYNIALSNFTELQKIRDELLDKYKNIKKEDKERLDHFLPSSINNIELILEVEKIANLHYMPVINVTFNPVGEDEDNSDEGNRNGSNVKITDNDPSKYLPYGIFPIEFSIEGTYSNFVSFLKDLEKNLRLVDIKSISFEVPSQDKNSKGETVNLNIYHYKIKIDAYWLK